MTIDHDVIGCWEITAHCDWLAERTPLLVATHFQFWQQHFLCLYGRQWGELSRYYIFCCLWCTTGDGWYQWASEFRAQCQLKYQCCHWAWWRHGISSWIKRSHRLARGNITTISFWLLAVLVLLLRQWESRGYSNHPHLWFCLSVILSVCDSVCPHDKMKTAETKITKLSTGIVHQDVSSWLGGSVVERRSLTGELSLVCTGPAADQ